MHYIEHMLSAVYSNLFFGVLLCLVTEQYDIVMIDRKEEKERNGSLNASMVLMSVTAT